MIQLLACGEYNYYIIRLCDLNIAKKPSEKLVIKPVNDRLAEEPLNKQQQMQGT